MSNCDSCLPGEGSLPTEGGSDRGVFVLLCLYRYPTPIWYPWCHSQYPTPTPGDGHVVSCDSLSPVQGALCCGKAFTPSLIRGASANLGAPTRSVELLRANGIWFLIPEPQMWATLSSDGEGSSDSPRQMRNPSYRPLGAPSTPTWVYEDSHPASYPPPHPFPPDTS